MAYKAKETHFCISKVSNLPESAKNQVYWAREKSKVEHDETELHLHREWTIVIFEWFVMNCSGSSWTFLTK